VYNASFFSSSREHPDTLDEALQMICAVPTLQEGQPTAQLKMVLVRGVNLTASSSGSCWSKNSSSPVAGSLVQGKLPQAEAVCCRSRRSTEGQFMQLDDYRLSAPLFPA